MSSPVKGEIDESMAMGRGLNEMSDVRVEKGVRATGGKEVGSARIPQLDATGLAHLLVVYLVYGSTYLAIRVAVREGSGFPPFTLGLMRIALASGILLLWAALRGHRLRPSRQEFWVLAVSGLLFWTAGNGLVSWAEQGADSGLAALIVASTPIWAALIEAIIDRHLPSKRFVAALLAGFAGIVLLSTPALRAGKRTDMLAVAALLGASASWAAGSILQSRRPIALSPQVSSGYQQLFGFLGFIFTVLLANEPRPTPLADAWLAWGYLVLFGSVLGFTSFVQVLHRLPTSVAMTYAYVNPVIAVVLGAIILSESITLWTVGGAALVLLGVAGVFRERYTPDTGARARSA
jgi:drug/metabolite transporter (DMT)-like permease